MDSKTILTAVIVVLFLGTVVINLLRRRTYNKLQAHIAQGAWNELFALIDAPLTKRLFPAYNLEYLRLNAYLMQDDLAHAEELFEDLLQRRLPSSQRVDLVAKALSFYVGQNDRDRAEELLGEIENWSGEKCEPVKRDSRRLFDIAMLGRTSYIEEMEAELPQLSGLERGRHAYLIALQYENLGDLKQRDKYLELAAKDSFRVG